MNKAVIYGLGIFLFFAAFLISVLSTKPIVSDASDVPEEFGETEKQDGNRTLEWISNNLEKSYAVDGVMDVVRSEARTDPEGTGNWVMVWSLE